MTDYSSDTKVEPTLVGWLSIAEANYKLALQNDTTSIERRRARLKARRAMREARSLSPNLRRFAVTGLLESNR